MGGGDPDRDRHCSWIVLAALYRDAPYWTEQARGIDLATLFLAVPILVVSLWLVRQGSAPAGAAAIGVLLYLVYNYVIYSISVAMNRLAFVYIAILGALHLEFDSAFSRPHGSAQLVEPKLASSARGWR